MKLSISSSPLGFFRLSSSNSCEQHGGHQLLDVFGPPQAGQRP